jgi:Heavy metal associated domain 2
MDESPRQQGYQAEIASDLPGRLRLRFRRGQPHPHILDHLQATLTARPEIREVSVNPAAHCLTLHYDASQQSCTGLLGVLADLNVLVSAVTGAPRLEDVTVQALDDLDRRVLALTGQRVNLRTLFPVGLAGLGLALTLKNGLGLGMLPGWVPLWLAFDAFVKLHREPSGAAEPPGGARPSASPWER